MSDPIQPIALQEGRTAPSKVLGLVLTGLALLWLLWSNGLTTSQARSIAVSVLIPAAIYAVAALGLNIHFGYTGLLNFGQVAFMAVGAYTVAWLVPHTVGRNAIPGGSWPLFPALLVAMAFAALLGLLIGIPTLRLRGDYLAIATIAVGEILRLTARNFEVTGQAFGFTRFSGSLHDLRPGFVDSWAESLGVTPAALWLLFVAWGIVVVVVAFLALLLRSPWARVLRAIKEDEDAARALGKNVFRYKLQSFMIGGAIGGLAGALLAFHFANARPSAFLPQVTFFVWAVMILGGAGSLAGPVFGSVIFWVVLTQTDDLVADIWGTLSGQTSAGIRFAIVGAMIMVLMVFRPQGLFGKREELLLDIK